MNEECISCGKCCRQHWLLKLTNNYEKRLFEGKLVFGDYIWTDQCKFFAENKCTIHDERQPYKCKEYFCEGRFVNVVL